MNFAIYTLGCKVNQYETQAMEAELLRRGHHQVPFPAAADAYIVNTCTVTASGDKKCRIVIRQARKRGPHAVVAVCGCYAQTAPEVMEALGADLISGTGGRVEFLNELEKMQQSRAGESAHGAGVNLVDNALTRKDFEVLPAGGMEGRTRAMLKVEDGCGNFCSYCMIPYARGPVRALPLAAAAAQAERLAGEGYREIVVTGIEISSWQEGEATLIDLIEAVCAAAPQVRIRLGSLEPRTVSAEFCRRAKGLKNLCPQFHLSLQSGCDATLRRMNRRYDTARYLHSVELLRAAFDRPAVTTDLIVGFPGETEQELEQTLRFLRTCGFAAVHVFPYSRRAGTPADRFPGQLTVTEKEARAVRARAVAAELENAYLSTWVGQTLPVLFEHFHGGLWRGHAPNYAEVHAGGENLHNTVQQVEITAAEGGILRGRVV